MERRSGGGCGCDYEVPGDREEEERPAEQQEDELGWARSGLGLPKLLGLATMADQSEIRIENFLSFFQYNDIKKKEISRGT